MCLSGGVARGKQRFEVIFFNVSNPCDMLRFKGCGLEKLLHIASFTFTPGFSTNAAGFGFVLFVVHASEVSDILAGTLRANGSVLNRWRQ